MANEQTTGHGAKLTRKYEQAISALLVSPTVDAAAEAIGTHACTLRRWMRLPEFAEAYREARRAALETSISQLQQITGTAVETLRDVMENSARDASRVTAARAVLEMALRAMELQDLEARIEVLERKAEIK